MTREDDYHALSPDHWLHIFPTGQAREAWLANHPQANPITPQQAQQLQPTHIIGHNDDGAIAWAQHPSPKPKWGIGGQR
jgi:hypothetical protein